MTDRGIEAIYYVSIDVAAIGLDIGWNDTWSLVAICPVHSLGLVEESGRASWYCPNCRRSYTPEHGYETAVRWTVDSSSRYYSIDIWVQRWLHDPTAEVELKFSE